MSEQKERFVEYSSGKNCLPWIGWMEGPDGGATGFVTVDGSIWRSSGDKTDAEPTATSRHTAEWNNIRDLTISAMAAPRGNGDRVDYWPGDAVACLVSLAIKTGDRLASQKQASKHWPTVRGALRDLFHLLHGEERATRSPAVVQFKDRYGNEWVLSSATDDPTTWKAACNGVDHSGDAKDYVWRTLAEAASESGEPSDPDGPRQLYRELIEAADPSVDPDG